MKGNELRYKLQSYRFAAHDMLLYLDTHPCDKKAFSLFKSLTSKASELQSEYAEKYSPVTAQEAAKTEEFNWIGSPWPWEKGGND